MTAALRTTFATPRARDFASVEELTRETGQPAEAWPLVVVKELVDNALDACEEADVAPVVTVRVEAGWIEVTDSGPGIPAATVAGVVDFESRVSSRSAYVAPDRGAQGNALKTIVAMPFALGSGAPGEVEVAARGERHRIAFGLDALRQRPEVTLATEPDPAVRSGTSVRVRWPRRASSILAAAEHDLYRTVRNYAVFNPHLDLTLNLGGGSRWRHPAADPSWRKWKPSRPSSAHWYTTERLARLIAAYIKHDDETDDGAVRTVRDFLALFDGLSGTTKRKAVLDATGLHRAPLRALVGADGFDDEAVARLLRAMQTNSREVAPRTLGVIGAEALRARFEAGGVDLETFRYQRVEGIDRDLPWLVEVAFGYCPRSSERDLVTGVNWSPAMTNPFRALRFPGAGDSLDGLLSELWADDEQPVTIAVHLAMPGVSYTDRGKTALSLPYAVGAAISDAVIKVTKRWARHMAAVHRNRAQEVRRRDALAGRRPKSVTIKDAAYAVMREAYLKASAGGTLPANARQIYYAARPAILEMTGKDEVRSSYFIQDILKPYLEEHRDEAAEWDVVFDARGHLVEPHTRREVPLGTLDVRRYLADRPRPWEMTGESTYGFTWPTVGPGGRFGAVLFIEKQGFDPLLQAARLAERYDLAIMSTKGMSVIAARKLIDGWGAGHPGLKVLVARDFDISGFSIFGTFGRDSKTYRFENDVDVIDLGLRLDDVERLGLEDEPVTHGKDWNKVAATLRGHGATDAEVAFLRTHRVELNAFASDQLIRWLEGKLAVHGVQKVVPDSATLERAARAAWRVAARNELLVTMADELAAEAAAARLPSDLAERVQELLGNQPSMAWDTAIEEIVGQLRDPDGADSGDEYF